MKIIAMLLAVFSISSVASASGHNLIVCANPDSDENLAIREDQGGQLVGLYSAELNWSGGQTTVAYKVEKEGEFDFAGKDLSFKFDPGSDSRHGVGTFSIKSLGIESEQIDCELK